METPLSCAVLTDGHAGNRRQALALAHALGLVATEPSLRVPAPWRWAAPRRLPGAQRAMDPMLATFRDTPPRVAIGCGRQGAMVTRLLRGCCPTVQILDPRIDPGHWDHLVVPEHDALRGDQVITLMGSLNPVDAAWLAHQRALDPGRGQCPGPRTAVFIGGPTRAAPWDAMLLASLAAQLRGLASDEGGTVWITGSRRTPVRMRQLLRAALAGHAQLWFEESDGPNPYLGQLAWADRIVVTPDSANLLSEAAATHVPIFVAFPGIASGRIGRLLAQLTHRDRMRPMDVRLDHWTVTPLQETARVAALLRERLGLVAPGQP